MIEKNYYSLRLVGTNAFHEDGDVLKTTNKVLHIGETADCGIKFESGKYEPERYASIVENEDGEVVGMADVVNFDPQHRRAELGIVIQKDFRHAGYAFAAVQEVLQYSLHILHLHQVYVIINEQHVEVINLFNKLAFKESARLSDWLYDGREYHDAILLQRIL